MVLSDKHLNVVTMEQDNYRDTGKCRVDNLSQIPWDIGL